MPLAPLLAVQRVDSRLHAPARVTGRLSRPSGEHRLPVARTPPVAVPPGPPRAVPETRPPLQTSATSSGGHYSLLPRNDTGSHRRDYRPHAGQAASWLASTAPLS